ncbi:hypothetical protein [Yanghanlia caeni]|uniref:Transposase n=1 Tax=Yanghanlia caeni TaxID=3064283 RepID=A0ABU1D2S5_9BURK|nr:hypothetical protein [Alcaligenaceae bacterium LG-2]HZH55699.1 hypothetical protein [Burkholderiaceae bacterium]
MARLPRLYAPDTAQLAQARFARPLATPHDPTPSAALDQIRDWLAAEVRAHALAVHGWAIVPDRIVLLATPATPSGLSRVIQGMGRRMATRLTLGRVFEGRYRSALLDAAWVPAGLVWVESLPVQLGYVDVPQRWPWSSAREHVGLRSEGGWMTEHAGYWGLGNTPFARQASHQVRLESGLSEADATRIERAVFGQWALGEAGFMATLSARSNRRVAPAPRGRPRKAPIENTVTK